MMIANINNFLGDILPTLRIAVVGDVMIDSYIFGEVERISPEAPVPINRVVKQKSTLGGAANVASNLANLGCQVYLGGLVGDDEHRHQLVSLLEKEGIDSTGLVMEANRKTTMKLRILGARQQMMRLDFEETGFISPEASISLQRWLEALCEQGISGIVISDYGKGVCTPEKVQAIISLAREKGILTIVDPKGSDWSKYRGASLITPNVKELSECVGYKVENEDAPIIEAAQKVITTYGIERVVVTRSAKGITLCDKEGQVWHDPATQQEVFDVSGAGDTVVAMMITALGGGLSEQEALKVSNGAAGVVVAKVGTYPIHREELLDWAEAQGHDKRQSTILSKADLAERIRHWQSRGEAVVFTNGCFDILHRGHVSYLQEAASLGQHFVVALNSDDSVRRLKGETRPLVKGEDRAFLMKALGCVDEVVLFEEDTPYELLELLRPDILVKGGDYKAEEVVGRDLVKEVVIIPFEEGYSTTSLVQKIAQLAKEGKL